MKDRVKTAIVLGILLILLLLLSHMRWVMPVAAALLAFMGWAFCCAYIIV